MVVTGGTKGLGLAIARVLCDCGYRVIATGRSCTKDLQAEMISYGNNLHYEPLDLGKDNLHEVVKQWKKNYGNFYGLINNAALGYDGVLATMHDSEVHELIHVNLISTILLTKYMTRSMLLNREGRIVNISSIIANTGFNGLSVYAASKAGLVGFTKSLARELGKANITVNAILPGYMKTNMTTGLEQKKLDSIIRRSPLKSLISTEDVANWVSYLLNESSKHVTGSCFTIDAGSTA